MPDFIPPHHLTHEASMKMIAAGVAKTNELGVKISLAAADRSCQLIGFLMMDGARIFLGRATIKKALTAASQHVATGYARKDDVVSLQIRMDGDFTNVRGGLPIVLDGETIGAIAAGGATEDEDVIIAKAALAASQLRPSH